MLYSSDSPDSGRVSSRPLRAGTGGGGGLSGMTGAGGDGVLYRLPSEKSIRSPLGRGGGLKAGGDASNMDIRPLKEERFLSKSAKGSTVKSLSGFVASLGTVSYNESSSGFWLPLCLWTSPELVDGVKYEYAAVSSCGLFTLGVVVCEGGLGDSKHWASNAFILTPGLSMGTQW